MDNISTETFFPPSHHGSEDQNSGSPVGTGSSILPNSNDLSNEDDMQAIGSDGIYENILQPEDEEPLYDDVTDLRTAGHETDELINTEINYVHSLRMLTSHIQPRLAKIREVNVKSLFCNVDELLLLHESFLSELKKTEKDEQNQLCRIASLFQEFSKDLENAYALYCYGYARSTSLLQSYQEMQISERILEVLQTVPNWDSAKQYQDLSFYLVQPVQRITRYPLLLKNILKGAPQDRESQEALQRALETMNIVNININENKRRKEIASKYLQSDQRTLIEKMSQLSTHTISKKTNRLSHFIKRETGMSPKKEDKEFDTLSERFHRLTTAINQLEENLATYVKNVETFLSIQPQTYPLEFLQETMHPVQEYSQERCIRVYPVFKRRLQLLVLQPLSNLSECLKGPKNLIKKRTDKLLDYEKLEEKYSETGKMTYEEEDIVNNYKALNAMLLSELPHCISLSLQWLHKILLTFITLQKELSEHGYRAAEKGASQAQYSAASDAQFCRWVEETFRQSESQLSEFIKKFDESLPPIEQEHSPATERQIQQLLKRYGSKKLYQVVISFSGSKEMELSLSRGDVVAVIQFADTKGNRNRWLVDTGGTRGYVPSNKLQPYQVEQSPTHLQVSESNPLAERRRDSLTPQVCPYPTSPVYLEAFQIVAGYPFTARSQVEVSIMAGEPVTVLEPHDKEGRPEWSLVEVNGQRGYVPSSYLIRVPVQANIRRPSQGTFYT